MTQLVDLPSAEVSAYGASLRRRRPSARLDARIAEAIARHRSERHALGGWRKINARRIGPALAAGCAAIVMAASMLWLGRSVQREAAPEEVAGALESTELASAPQAYGVEPSAPAAEPAVTDDDALAVVPTGQYSLWPTDAAVFRVRTDLNTLRAVSAALPAGGERQYWVDVRVANDGSMRIVRVVPVDDAR